MSSRRTRSTPVTRTALRLTWRVFFTVTCLGLALPEAAYALKRLDVFYNHVGIVYHRWSYNDGANWSPLTLVPSRSCDGRTAYSIEGSVSAVSDRIGFLWLAAKTSDGRIVINRFTAGNGTWMGWCATHSGAGSVSASSSSSGFGGFVTPGLNFWNADSYPAITSWGTGRLDLFMHASKSDGRIVLVHGWRTSDNGEFSWETLGSGLMQGSPAAVSWGPGRIDVFARGGGADLAHKYFDGGRWYPWQSLGQPWSGPIAGSPAVMSTGSQQLSVYVTDTYGRLHHRWFGAMWFGWEDLSMPGGPIDPHIRPTVTTKDEWTLDVFVMGPFINMYRRTFFFGWSNYIFQEHVSVSGLTAYYWPYL